MAQDELREDVRKLIAEHITSVEQLEILLLLRSEPDREWSAADVSAEMRTSYRSASGRLADLTRRGLLGARDRDGVALFRFVPTTEWLRHATEHLAEAYVERRYTVIDLIFSKPIDDLKLYADAFRFRKGEPDG